MRSLNKHLIFPIFIILIISLIITFFYLSIVIEIKNDELTTANLESFHKNNISFLENYANNDQYKYIFNNDKNLYSYIINQKGEIIEGKKYNGTKIELEILKSCKANNGQLVKFKNNKITFNAFTKMLDKEYCFVSESSNSYSTMLSGLLLNQSYLVIIIIAFLISFLLWLLSRNIRKKILLITNNLELVASGEMEFWRNTKSKIKELINLEDELSLVIERLRNKELRNQEKNKVNTINIVKVKNEKEQLDLEMNRFKKAFDNAFNMMYILTTKGLIIYGNKSLLDNLQMKFSEIEGKVPTEIWHYQTEATLWEEKIKSLIDTQKNQKFDCKGIRKNKNNAENVEYESEIIISPIFNNLNEIENILVIEKDVSEERQKDRIKTEFISVISHELRTPMTIIRGYSSILAEEKIGSLNEKQAEYVKKINDETGRLLNLANDMLDLQKFKAGKVKLQLENINLREMLQDIRSEYEGIYQKKGLYLTFENYATKVNVSIDKRYFNRAIANLLNNALKFTEKGGVKIQLLNTDNNTLVVAIKDTGVGIPAEAVEHLFTKFYQASNVLNRKQEGSGLGLSIVKNIVEAHDGIVWAESKEGVGSTFYIALNL